MCFETTGRPPPPVAGRAGVRTDRFELETYAGAPHSFFDRTFDRFKDACDNGWRRMLAFVEHNSAWAS